MRKTRKKWLCLLLTLAMLVGLMVPFAGSAAAATSYSVAPIAVKAGQYNLQPTYITINLDPGTMFNADVNNGGYVYLRLPSYPTGYGMEFQYFGASIQNAVYFDYNSPEGFVPKQVNGNDNSVAAFKLVPTSGRSQVTDSQNNTHTVYREWQLIVYPNTNARANAGQVVLPVLGLYVPGGVSGDITLVFDAPQGSPFTSGSVVIGRASSGTVTVASESTPSFGSGGIGSSNAAVIDIKEDIPGAFAISDSSVKLTLPPGFSWKDPVVIMQKWGSLDRNGDGRLDKTYDYVDYSITDNNGRDLKIAIKTGANLSQANFITVQAGIQVDESVAKPGDVTVTVGGDSTVTPSSIVVGKYGEYGVTVTAQSVADITAGKANVEIGKIKIAEALANSLVPGRTITLTLQGNAVWATDDPQLDNSLSTNYYSFQFTGWNAVGSDGKTIKLTLPSTGFNETDASTLVLKNLKVTTAPDFTGDLNVVVGGSAIGQEVTLKLANVKPAVTASVASAPNVNIGSQGVAVGDFTITENYAGAIDSQVTYVDNSANGRTASTSTSTQAKIILEAPIGVTFATTPTVTVTNGDLQIDAGEVSTTTTADGKGQCIIPVKSQSTVASTIKVSNIKLTFDRTVPEGPVALKVKGSAVNESLAKDGSAVVFPANTVAAKATVANVVTPSAQESRQSASFVIGSTTYTVNGVQSTMDVAPYTKDGRTYLPVRYVAYALGITPDNVIWDGTKATFIGRGRVVQVAPGSNIMTINGAAVTMDVQAEEVNGRIMVPFRWVAQAFGAQVNWDEATQTVSMNL